MAAQYDCAIIAFTCRMFNFFKSQEDKEIENLVQAFMQRLIALGDSVVGDIIQYKSIFNLSQEEIVGRLNFAFYQVQIYRLLGIVDLKSSKSYADKFGAILGKAMTADRQIGYGAFQDLCSFISPQNRMRIGSVGVKGAISHWVLNRIFEISNPTAHQIQTIRSLVLYANRMVDQHIEAISPKFALSVVELAALNDD